jgi:hypothetical protein
MVSNPYAAGRAHATVRLVGRIPGISPAGCGGLPCIEARNVKEFDVDQPS